MGVSGCGKSEIGRRLALRLGIDFVEGDDHHSLGAIAKMRNGMPLADEDRKEWLLHLRSRIAHACDNAEGLVMSCSALKRSYRDLLREGDPALLFVHLNGDKAPLASRIGARAGHFMPLSLLDSQFSDLQPLAENERGFRLDIQQHPVELVNEIIRRHTEIFIV
ncbi:MAG TPA: gluconokinase [Burkholderiaceae bacterium]|nr:gluconokinase [Burkholderiaceae bacterium]